MQSVKTLVEAEKVTGFTHTEVQAVGLAKLGDFPCRKDVKAEGGWFSRAGDWCPCAGRLAETSIVAPCLGVAARIGQMKEEI